MGTEDMLSVGDVDSAIYKIVTDLCAWSGKQRLHLEIQFRTYRTGEFRSISANFTKSQTGHRYKILFPFPSTSEHQLAQETVRGDIVNLQRAVRRVCDGYLVAWKQIDSPARKNFDK